ITRELLERFPQLTVVPYSDHGEPLIETLQSLSRMAVEYQQQHPIDRNTHYLAAILGSDADILSDNLAKYESPEFDEIRRLSGIGLYAQARQKLQRLVDVIEARCLDLSDSKLQSQNQCQLRKSY